MGKHIGRTTKQEQVSFTTARPVAHEWKLMPTAAIEGLIAMLKHGFESGNGFLQLSYIGRRVGDR